MYVLARWVMCNLKNVSKRRIGPDRQYRKLFHRACSIKGSMRLFQSSLQCSLGSNQLEGHTDWYIVDVFVHRLWVHLTTSLRKDSLSCNRFGNGSQMRDTILRQAGVPAAPGPSLEKQQEISAPRALLQCILIAQCMYVGFIGHLNFLWAD